MQQTLHQEGEAEQGHPPKLRPIDIFIGLQPNVLAKDWESVAVWRAGKYICKYKWEISLIKNPKSAPIYKIELVKKEVV